MTKSSLAQQIAATLRRERTSRFLTQQALADLAGISQSALARIERGDRVPSIPLVERAFATLDLQLRVTVEQLDAHLDAQLDELAARPLADRLDDLPLDRVLERLGDLPHLLTGCTAALIQGVPAPVDGIDLAVRWRDSARFTAWLEAVYGQRWNERWGDYGGLRLEPEEPGEHRWRTRYGEIRAQMCDELPEAIEVKHRDRGYRVVPVGVLELTDPRTASLLQRWRSRAAG
ncbi:helix-turn-helix domain-containing protein [Micromonospora sp. WMMD558]|uniref:helix-turn-helix domain-containing protein n=1 Tax=Micromonospora sp. WMMD558 TaxID=3403462 RepID=UPI003BF4D933